MPDAQQNPNRHRAEGAILGGASVALITVSDTRTRETDTNGIWLREMVLALGHQIVVDHLVEDDSKPLLRSLSSAISADAHVVIFNGGTGVGNRDVTVDVIAPLLQKPLPGFGELFRMLSWEQIGSAAMLSRALAGRIGNSMVFVVPGSHAAVQLAWTRLIAPEIPHLLRELQS